MACPLLLESSFVWKLTPRTCEDGSVPARLRVIMTWIVFSGLGVAFLVAVAVGYTATVLPGCASCHMTGSFGSETLASPHADVACVGCHVDNTMTGRVSFAFRELFHMVVPIVDDLDRSYAEVPSERCKQCHMDILDSGIRGVRGLRMQHVTCVGGSDCTDCHSLTAHGAATVWPRTAQMEGCYECHGRTNQVTDCDACHSGQRERQDVFDGPFRITHGVEWETTHGMGDMGICGACHDASKCAGCHGAGVPHGGAFLSRHAEFSVAQDAQCTSCHREDLCIDCHRYPMPHSVEFVLNHSNTVASDGETACRTCHDERDCTACHTAHVHPVTQEQIEGFMREGGAR